jgi:chaperone modulatory protein CbpM
MRRENFISIDEFCAKNKIEISFIWSLQQAGLIEITTIKETEFIEVDQLRLLEKFIHFSYDLEISLEGIETIMHLLVRINNMQDEIRSLRNRLIHYEIEV